jgi:hypothetical protein
MNIDFAESPTLVIAKTCGCKESRIKITYSLLNETHSLCFDKKDLITGQLEACEKLLAHVGDQNDRVALEHEIRELKMALDLMT